MRRRIGALSVILLACALRPASGVSASTVYTFSGSGIPGILDGAATRAQFLMPTALAYAGKDLLVVDTAAQRIRSVAPDGAVRTIAGGGPFDKTSLSVKPDYRDGDARSARFNWPRAIAVAPDGAVYVADTGNHAVRSIKNGVVSTVLGGPRQIGRTLSRPMSVAVDSAGALYVADPDIGLLKLSPTGALTVVPGPRSPFAVAVFDTQNSQNLFTVDSEGVLEQVPGAPSNRLRALNSAQDDFLDPFRAQAPPPAPTDTPILQRRMANDVPIGFPSSLAVINRDTLFFGDVRTNSVRYLWPGWAPEMRVIAGPGTEDAANGAAGFADGEGSAARFNAPMGAAIRDAGTIMVADAGNHRIRGVRYDAEHEFYADAGAALDDEAVTSAGEDTYRIALIGNSNVWFDTSWADAIPGILQAQLRADRTPARIPLQPVVRVVGGVGTLDTLDSLTQTIAATGLYKCVILNLNHYNLMGSAKDVGRYPERLTQTSQQLRKARTVLAAAGIPFLVALQPSADELSPIQALLARIDAGMDPGREFHEAVKAAVAAAGVELIDTYPDFESADTNPVPLFLDDGVHFNRQGRLQMGKAVARGLERLQPWAKELSPR